MSGPRSRFITNPIKGGANDASTFWEHSYDGLLVTQTNRKNPKGKWITGGPFYVHRQGLQLESQPFHYNWIRNGSLLKGTVLPLPFSTVIPTIPLVPTYGSFLPSLGASYQTGFRRTRPGNPVASAGQFLIELRDLPTTPLKMLHRLQTFRALGSEYLNIQFGWKPFVTDLQKMYNLWHTIDKRLAQIVRDNGRGIRRRCTIEESSSTSQVINTSVAVLAFTAGTPPNVATSSGTRETVTTTTKRKIWYAAKYQYYIPDIGSSRWTKRARLALFGLLPTPELIWSVLPWSWLVGWFSNIGDVVSNGSTNAIENLTCKYSYVMDWQRTEVIHQVDSQWIANFLPNNNIPAGHVIMSSNSYVEHKLRTGGFNPFGLGVSFGSLSNYQIGILAALGLSRGLVK